MNRSTKIRFAIVCVAGGLAGAALTACQEPGTCLPCPVPEPRLNPLAWAPTPPLDPIDVGAEAVHTFMLTAAVDATYTVTASDSAIAVSGTPLSPGVLEVTIEGLAEGASGFTLTAEAPGYTTATTTVAVEIEDPPLRGVIIDSGDPELQIACRDFDDFEFLFLALYDESFDSTTEAEWTRLFLAEECAWFEAGDAIEWRGERRPIQVGVGVEVISIRVWGNPKVAGDETGGRRTGYDDWWVLQFVTSFPEASR